MEHSDPSTFWLAGKEVEGRHSLPGSLEVVCEGRITWVDLKDVECPDDDLVAGGCDIPEEMIDKDVIGFTNFPDDELSRYILQLIGLHLNKMTDEQKRTLAKDLRDILSIEIKSEIHPRRVTKTLEGLAMFDPEPQSFVNTVYEFCHIARETRCQHQDWVERFLNTERELLSAMEAPRRKTMQDGEVNPLIGE